MGSFTNGILVGVGISLLVAPKTGKEMRHLVVERFGYLRGIPPENKELKQQVQQMTGRVQEVQQQANHAAEMGSQVQDVAQQTARSADSMQRDLSQAAQQTGTNVPPTRSGNAPSDQQNRPGKSSR